MVECADNSDRNRVEQIINMFKQRAEHIRVHDFNAHDKQNKEWVFCSVLVSVLIYKFKAALIGMHLLSWSIFLTINIL